MGKLLGAIPKDQAKVIPVLGFATLKRFDLAQRLLDSIDHPVENVVIVNNSGTREFKPVVNEHVKNLWHIEVPHGLGANGAWNLIIKSTPFAPYWVLPNDDCYFEAGALAKIADQADSDCFNFVNVLPTWSCPIPGEGAIMRAGLWDEAFHPIYFDDDDFQRRLKHYGVEPKHIDANVLHDNSSTLKAGFDQVNSKTFINNLHLHQEKVRTEDYSVHGWSLKIRRENRWD